MKWLSLFGFVLAVIALLALFEMHALFSASPWAIALQVAAILLMLWARMTFGLRSFHAGAEPTAGGLVTSGPYRYIRHPIYSAICLFIWTAVFAHFSPVTVSLGLLATVGVFIRVRCEEKLVIQRYPEYRDYSARTKRLIPGIW